MILVPVCTLMTERLLFQNLEGDVADLFEVYGMKIRGNQNVRNLRSAYGLRGVQDQWIEESRVSTRRRREQRRQT